MNTATDLRPSPRESNLAHGWKWNLLVFGLLVLTVLLYFYWQAAQARQDFVKRSTDHSRMLASIISFSLSNAKASQESIEKTIHTFLESSAKFVDYLDSIEPFSSEELTAFADETGLAGIKILHDMTPPIAGPAGWNPEAVCQAPDKALRHLASQRLYLLTWPRTSDTGCIVIGFDSQQTDRLVAQIGIDHLIRDLSGLPLIDSIRIEEKTAPGRTEEIPAVQIVNRQGHYVAETSTPFADGMLIVATDATPYMRRMAKLKEELLLFSLLLIGLGTFFSWILYRYQRAFLERATSYERRLAKQREEAALGRSAAIISHEIKNPLNAIGMGLQRLEMEADLPPEQKRLIASMRQAVARTSTITTALKEVTQPLSPRFQEVSPRQLTSAALTLYRDQCRQHGIEVEFEADTQDSIEADETLFGQLLENLIKNALEAQPDGGYIRIVLQRQGNDFLLTMSNGGFAADVPALTDILEPYYTTKTQGTGLGLAICRRIVEAHGGEITPDVPAPGVLRMTVRIPCQQPTSTRG